MISHASASLDFLLSDTDLHHRTMYRKAESMEEGFVLLERRESQKMGVGYTSMRFSDAYCYPIILKSRLSLG
jgi:hypothetical protein